MIQMNSNKRIIKMKELVKYINEMHNSEYNADKYKEDKRHEPLKKLAQVYVDYVSIDKIKESVDNAIEETNKLLKLMNDNGISEFVNGQMLGRIIERKLALSIGDSWTGFKFQQGQEASEDKDIECKTVPQELIDKIKNLDIKLNDLVNLNNAHGYGIELKCSQGSGITGNKSYALDIADGNSKSTKSCKDAFYILINYKAPVEIPISVNDIDSESIKKLGKTEFKISSYNVYFGFIEQNDWVYGDKGNAASLKMGILKEKRLIKIN